MILIYCVVVAIEGLSVASLKDILFQRESGRVELIEE